MYRIHLPSKTGFRITRPDLPVIIRDNNSKLFYSSEYKCPDVLEFNLPAGNYWLDKGAIRSIPTPINYPLLPLPKKERNRPIPKDFKMVWGDNPQMKCTIIWPAKTILFDYALQDYTKPELDFIKFHEFSHANYHTEKYCDLKAANYMLLKGYNPIQIGLSQIDSLSPKQIERKNFLTNMLINHFGSL